MMSFVQLLDDLRVDECSNEDPGPRLEIPEGPLVFLRGKEKT